MKLKEDIIMKYSLLLYITTHHVIILTYMELNQIGQVNLSDVSFNYAFAHNKILKQHSYQIQNNNAILVCQYLQLSLH